MFGKLQRMRKQGRLRIGSRKRATRGLHKGEKPMSKFKATTPDGKTVFGNLIRWELLSCWMVHENGETLIDPDTIEKLSDGE